MAEKEGEKKRERAVGRGSMVTLSHHSRIYLASIKSIRSIKSIILETQPLDL